VLSSKRQAQLGSSALACPVLCCVAWGTTLEYNLHSVTTRALMLVTSSWCAYVEHWLRSSSRLLQRSSTLLPEGNEKSALAVLPQAG